MSSQHHVILGAGPAGVTAAETLRKQDPAADITLVPGEPEPPYSRMAIPYLLEGQISEDGTYLRQKKNHYDQLRISLRQGPARSVNTAGKSVTLEDGTALSYDTLLIATGASPVRPPIDGLDQPGVHTCWTLEDAREITALAEKGAPVVLVGAGFIGSIILESLAKKGVKLTVVEMGDRMVPRMLDETAGKMLQDWCGAQGVEVITGASVEAIKRAGDVDAARDASPSPSPQSSQLPQPGAGDLQPDRADSGRQGNTVGYLARLFGMPAAQTSPSSYPATGGTARSTTRKTAPVTNDNTPLAASEAVGGLQVQLAGGRTIDAKLVVIATGVQSNTAFLEGSGIATETGVTVNAHLETSAPGVYAAGDVCEGIDLSTGAHDMLAIQPVAVEHGYLAAMNMAGKPTAHRGSLNMNVLDTLGLISSSFGTWQGVQGGQSVTRVDEDAFKYMRLEFDGDKLVGAQCIGMTEHVGMLRGLIQTGLSLGVWKDRLLEAPERLPEAYVATAQGAPGHGPTAPKVALPV